LANRYGELADTPKCDRPSGNRHLLHCAVKCHRSCKVSMIEV